MTSMWANGVNENGSEKASFKFKKGLFMGKEFSLPFHALKYI